MSVTSASTRRTLGPSGDTANRSAPSVPDRMPASTPTPRSSSTAATSSAPGSCQLTEAWSGRTVQLRIRAGRAAGSGSAHAPVVTPTGTATRARIAASVSASTRGDNVSRPHGVLGWTWTSVAPAATAAAAESAIDSGVSGTAVPSAAVRGPFRHTCTMSAMVPAGTDSGGAASPAHPPRTRIRQADTSNLARLASARASGVSTGRGTRIPQSVQTGPAEGS
ncbi:hypothetical protein GCM10010383_45820 [Streptomyces lomondensis]|uniref:Uncharacterized protein n=1 Tax=Streptomyces lomondensis TaxID=68229 RepID=A0ABQ2XCS9_9ACTN|nr:hypothetical protein GCM10010383_45820 [Streptomyces lomondensis]